MQEQDLIKNVIDKVVAEVGIDNLYSPELPQWLTDLPPGQYTVNDLVKFSGTGRRNVGQMMQKYCKRIEYVKASKPHLQRCVYYWGD